MHRQITSLMLLCCVLAARGQTVLSYWLDDAYTARQMVGLEGNSWTGSINVSGTNDGIHVLHTQIVGNKPSPVTSQLFLKLSEQAAAPDFDGTIRYWIDDDFTGIISTPLGGGIFTIDVSALKDGIHVLHVVADNTSPVTSQLFVKLSEQAAAPDFDGTIRYWIDDNFANIISTPLDGGIFTIDVSELKFGIHTLHVVAGEIASSVMSQIFVRLSAQTDAPNFNGNVRYWIDDDFVNVVNRPLGDGLFAVDISALKDGIHTFHVVAGDDSPVISQLFLKLTERELPSFSKYEYWVNSEGFSTVGELPSEQSTVQLISLLPVAEKPIRSSCFHFAVEDTSPVIYAQNDIRLRFHLSDNHFTDVIQQYTDYRTKQVLTNIIPLEPNTSKSFSRPGRNSIQWLSFEAEAGDTVAFKLSQPATLQLFAPSGEEVFKTSESASVNWGGIHTWEEGTYYLAVHDVTGSQSTMKLEYMHMDKYDVVDWDVHTVGNGGCSTITFKGNGFRDLYAVDLYNTQGDSIKSVAVGFIDDANVSVTFNFTDVPLGNYNAVFHFTTENKKSHDIITVEEAKDIELVLEVRYPSSFLRGSSTTYTITVTNKGNSTAYDVPMEIYLSAAANSFEDITSVKFKDEQGKEFNNFSHYIIEENDSIDDETYAYIDEQVQKHFGHIFIAKKDSLSGEKYGFSDMLLTIPANSASTFYMEIVSTSTVNVFVRIPSDWLTIHSQRKSIEVRPKRVNALDRDWCCEKEKWECTEEILSEIAGLFPVAGCISSALDMWFYDVFEIACADGDDLWEKLSNFSYSLTNNKEKYKSYLTKGLNNLVGCLTGKIGKEMAVLRKAKAEKLAKKEKLLNDKKMYDKIVKQTELAKKEAEIMGNTQNVEEAEKTIREYLQLAADCENEANKLSNEILHLENQLAELKSKLADFLLNLKNLTQKGDLVSKLECYQAWSKAKAECPRNPIEEDGTSTPYTPVDPNDIYGYLSEAGSKFIADSVARVHYTIEFENDTTFATVAAHTIVIKDTLDSRYFDLTKFMPTGVRIGDREAFIDAADVVKKNNVTSFVKTIDMRPEINAIAQVDGTFSSKTGIAQWTLQSLDPMTMEPTDDLMQGILPVNFNGTSGIGEVMFEVGVKQGKADGTQIKNRAGIVFDYEEAILTPTWTNIVDAVAPSSFIDEVVNENDSTISFHFFGEDNASGIWKYRFYVQAGQNAPWWEIATDIAPDSTFCYRFYDDIDYGFCVLAVDSAGNVEKKVLQRECNFKAHDGDYEVNVDELPASSIGSAGDTRIYDLSGRRHDEPQEGINIIDNKKVLFRRKN